MRFSGARLVKLRLNDVAKCKFIQKLLYGKSLSHNPKYHEPVLYEE